MAFITFLRIILSFFLFTICLPFYSTAQLPACKDSFPTSLFPNSSFEQYSGCNIDYPAEEGGLIDVSPNLAGVIVDGWHIYREHWDVRYFNYNCRYDRPWSIFNTTSFFDSSRYYSKVPLPLPDSTGFISISQYNGLNNYQQITNVVKSYITTRLPAPLYAGQPYVFSFYFGFGTQDLTHSLENHASPSPVGFAIFGRLNCPDYPLKDTPTTLRCLTPSEGWIQLGRVRLSGSNRWVQGVIEFTPQTNISCIGIGPDCTVDVSIGDTTAMYYMDKFVLAPKADFSFKTITAVSGNACTGNFILKAPTYANASYQWYKGGTAIANATSQSYAVPDNADAAGDYQANISLPYNTCLNTLPYTVAFSDIKNFSLGNDTTACAPAEIQLNATWPGAQQYLWSDGSQRPVLTANKTGKYFVQVTDEYGCTKKDTIEVTIQGCDECELNIPSAFTPNNDGLNDVFRALPKCANIGFQHFKMRVYNRWGQIVFTSSDIHKGWDGTFKSLPLDTGTYIYYIDYAFKQNRPLSRKGTILLVR